MPHIILDANGKDSEPAYHGVDGSNGLDLTSNGQARKGADGKDAGTAEPGESGAFMKIELSTMAGGVNAPQHTMVCVTADAVCPPKKQGPGVAAPAARRIFHPRKNEYVVPLAELESLEWSARGGKGGDGGKGGNGGNGGRGVEGNQNTGHRGGKGGDGGMAGSGSSGARGGNGGQVQLFVSPADSYLLMAVGGCDPRTGAVERVAPGMGGKPGSHGTPGVGGAGGSIVDTPHKAPALDDDSAMPKSKQKPRSGETAGTPGNDGSAPTHELVEGERGDYGAFDIGIGAVSGSHQFFDSRYDLALKDSPDTALSQLVAEDRSPIFEFGETVLIQKCTLENLGPMPSPSQRVMICVDENSENLIADKMSRLFLPVNTCIGSGKVGVADQGFLRFKTSKPNFPTLGEDFEPVREIARKRFRAFQLGPEFDKKSKRSEGTSEFCVEYKNFDYENGERVTLAFPIENTTGVVGLRALSTGEATNVKFHIENISRQNLGIESASRRRVVVQHFLNRDKAHDIGFEKVDLRLLKNGKRSKDSKCLDPDIVDPLGFKGHAVTVEDLPAEGTVVVEHLFRLSKKTLPFTKAALQIDVFLQDIQTPLLNGSTKKSRVMSLVQRRKFVVSCQPPYKPNPSSRVVLVTSTSTTREQYSAWMSMLTDKFGLDTEVYSVSLHGHLEPSRGLPLTLDDKPKNPPILRELFAGKLVIVLNDEYEPLPNERRKEMSRPSLLLSQVFDFDPSTHWLIVGGDSQSVKHLSSAATNLAPKLQKNDVDAPVVFDTSCEDDALALTDDNFSTYDEVTGLGKSARHIPTTSNDIRKFDCINEYKKFVSMAVTDERSGLESSADLRPGCDVVRISSKFRSEPSAESVDKFLNKQAEHLKRWLQGHDVVRNYAILVEFETPRQEGDIWLLGDLRVFRGASRNNNSVVLVENKASVNVAAPETIQSQSMLYAVGIALCTDATIECLCSVLGNDDPPEETVRVIRDSLVSDFLWDVSHFYDAKILGRSKHDDLQSPTIEAFLTNAALRSMLEDSTSSTELQQRLGAALSDLLGRLESVADSRDLKPWWAPLSRKHSTRRTFVQLVNRLKQQWKELLDMELVRTTRRDLEREVENYIKNERGKLFVASRSRWRAGLHHMHSTRNPTRYPKLLGVRRAFEIETENATEKIKKCVPIIITSARASDVEASHRERQQFAGLVGSLVRNERSQLLYQ